MKLCLMWLPWAPLHMPGMFFASRHLHLLFLLPRLLFPRESHVHSASVHTVVQPSAQILRGPWHISKIVLPFHINAFQLSAFFFFTVHPQS